MRIENFEQYVIKDASGCWLWQRAILPTGYPCASDKGKTYRVHREVTRLYYGEPISGQEALHNCDIRSCVNPAHLRWGTKLENMQDMRERDRASYHQRPTGIAHYKTKLTAKQVTDIRAALEAGTTGKVLAAQYDVTPQHISRIKHGDHWSLRNGGSNG